MLWSKHGACKGFGHALVILEYSHEEVTRRRLYGVNTSTNALLGMFSMLPAGNISREVMRIPILTEALCLCPRQR
jgi:hypothetical protein